MEPSTSRRAGATVPPVLLLLACAAPDDTRLAPEDPAPVVQPAEGPANAPIAGLSAEWQDRYEDGYRAFELIYGPSRGLGPTYINTTCVSCHAGAQRGPDVVTKMVVMDGDEPAADQSALPWGNTVRENVAAGGETPILPPEGVEGLFLSVRIGPAVYGRGYIEAVADSEIERVEAEQAAAGVVSGRINRITFSATDADSEFHDHVAGETGLIGRFGLKARVATLDEFAADALVGDMSITSPMRPTEHPNPDGVTDDNHDGVDVTLDTVNVLADFTRLVDIPPRPEGILTGEGDAAIGAARFAAVGCDLCHVPTLRTRADYPIPQLADIDAPLYSDLLLHDLGVLMLDGIEDGDATGTEWRTAPLLGLSHHATFLHDGRAETVGEAIAAHGGEAAFSVTAFDALPADERAAVEGYVLAL